MTLTVGSLFSGYEGLGLALGQVLDAQLAWVCDNDPAAAKVLARHYPGVPNLGDITTVDWATVEPVDIILGGSPCTDVSAAGRRLGLMPGTRSGLWTSMAEGIAFLRPHLVIFENVRGILSAKAHSDLEPCPWHLGGSGDGEPALRALGRVLGDLADIGFDAEWTGLRASDIGAPHQRHREFLIAWPSDDAADAAGLGRQRGGQHGDGGLDLRTAVAALPHADGAAGGERRVAAPGQAQGGGARPDAGRRGGAPADLTAALLPIPTAADGDRTSLTMVRGNPTLLGAVAPLPSASALLPTPRATDGAKGGPNQRGSSGDLMLPSAVAQLLPTPTVVDSRNTANFKPDGTPYSDGYGATLTDAARLLPTPTATPYGNNQSPSPGAAGRPSLDYTTDWGPFADAIARWESVLGRPAPDPRDEKRRLSPAFVEWMMGLAPGWVTDVPGLSRNDLLRLLGNGVIPQQCAAALPNLLAAWSAALGTERAA